MKSRQLFPFIFSLFFVCSASANSVILPTPQFPAPVNPAEITSDLSVIDGQVQIDNQFEAMQSLVEEKKLSAKSSHKSNGEHSLQLGAAASLLADPPPQYSFSNCTAFTLGTGLNTTLTTQGQVKCFNTYSATDIKIVAQASSQPAGVNYDIFVYYYNDVTSATEFKSSSTALGNVSEFSAAKMPAGNYIIYVQATSGSSSTPFVVGALGYSAFDQYEANDAIAYATPATGNSTWVGNTDHAGDIDYYIYTTGSTQTALAGRIVSSNHALQVFNGTSWVTVASPTNFSVASSSTYLFRVFNTAATNNTAVNYTLVLSRPAVSLGNAQVTNDENLTNIGLGLETFSRITFTGQARDENNVMVPYGVVTVIAYTVNQTVSQAVQTGANGAVNQTLNFTPCTGGGAYGEGSGGRDGIPSFWYSGMGSSVGFYQWCSP
jgi:hypothetical protein